MNHSFSLWTMQPHHNDANDHVVTQSVTTNKDERMGKDEVDEATLRDDVDEEILAVTDGRDPSSTMNRDDSPSTRSPQDGKSTADNQQISLLSMLGDMALFRDFFLAAFSDGYYSVACCAEEGFFPGGTFCEDHGKVSPIPGGFIETAVNSDGATRSPGSYSPTLQKTTSCDSRKIRKKPLAVAVGFNYAADINGRPIIVRRGNRRSPVETHRTSGSSGRPSSMGDSPTRSCVNNSPPPATISMSVNCEDTPRAASTSVSARESHKWRADHSSSSRSSSSSSTKSFTTSVRDRRITPDQEMRVGYPGHAGGSPSCNVIQASD